MPHQYYTTVVDGLEEVAWQEMQEALPDATLVRLEQGRVLFDASCEPRLLLGLRSVENAHAFVAEFDGITGEAESLELIRRRLAEVRFEDAISLCESIASPLPAPSFRITASRSGTHAFRSPDIAAAAGQGVVDSYGWRVDLTNFDLEIRVDVRHDKCLVGLRLSDRTLSQRSRVEHAAASLKSTVAYCMIRLLGWSADEVFLDPMCGAATILVERAALGPCRALVGGDCEGRSLAKARANLAATGADASLIRWDARRMSLRPGTVDRVVCNLPWGRRVSSHTANRHLYPAYVRRMATVLRDGGRAALLTLEKRLLTRLLEKHARLHLDEVWPLQLGGLRPSIYIVTKCPARRPGGGTEARAR